MTDTLVAPPTPVERAVSLPAINLLPPGIVERRELRRLQGRLGAGVVAAVVLVGVLAHLAGAQQHDADRKLAVEQQQVSALQRTAASYAGVTTTFTAVDNARATLRTALGQEVRFSRFLADLAVTVPADIQLTAVTASTTSATGATGATPSTTPAPSAGTGSAGTTGGAGTTGTPGTTALPGTANGIGTLSISGLAHSQDDVAQWLDQLATQRGVAGVYLVSSTREENDKGSHLKFDVAAVLTPAALSNRYSTADGGLR